MKEIKHLFIFLLFLFVQHQLVSQEFKFYPEELIKTFKVGKVLGEFAFVAFPNPMDPSGPNAMAFDSGGDLIVCDSWNYRLVKLDSRFNVKEKLSFDEFKGFASILHLTPKDNGSFLGDFGISIIGSIDKHGKPVFHLRFMGSVLSEIVDEDNIVEYNNYIFQYLRDGSGILCFPKPGMDNEENIRKVLKNEAVVALIKSGKKPELAGLSIDGKYRLFIKGELVTRNYKTFIEYYQDKYNIADFQMYRNDPKHRVKPVHKDGAANLIFIGRDVNRNCYWELFHKIMYVFNTAGWVVSAFQFDDEKSRILPTVHPSGDVYFMNYDEKEVRLYRIRNVWDPETQRTWEASLSPSTPTGPQYATSTESRVRVRAAANLHGQTLGHLEKGERVELLEQSGQKMRVGEMEDYWYRVRRLSDGLTGWAYGYFLKRER